MSSSSRYEVINTIAKGEFAVVYRARDRQLGREVAIKQIHEQYRADPRQLERYWREAQLLASLQHGNIVTIYDVDRSRGWLILELMRGSLKRTEQSKPLDLNLLRMVLIGSLNALQFLHSNGVVHGDIKPSNLLIDTRNRVKLGDFGLARRAASEGGSLLKGDTKYMAPELISTEFGPIGPASDLYSLGFTAYELLCGSRFEDLFPGLGSYGANRQIAWMMWHGAADRRLPEIGRVLEGVPDDLAKVINRLVAKDQTVRYKSATEALADLRADAGEIEPPPPTADAEQEAARQAAAKKKRQRRIVAAAALLCSLLVCVVLLLPSPEPPTVKPAEPPQGVVRQVYLLEKTITLETADGKPEEVRLRGETTVTINDQPGLVRDLREGDHVLVNTYRKESGQLVTELRVTRPEANQGRIVVVEPDKGRFEFVVDGQPDRQLSIAVPADLEITFNGKTTLDGRAVALADLKPDDRVTVHHLDGEAESRRATELAALRVVSTEGVLRELDAAKGTLTFAVGDEADAPMETLPLRPDCEVTINDRGVLDERRLRPADLRPGDQLKVMHDDRISRIDAYRVLGQKGVVSRIRLADRQIEATMEDGAKRMTLVVGDETRISLGGRTVELGELRPGDEIEVTHDSPDARMPELLTLAATRPVDRRRWAAMVSVENYEDGSVAPLPHARADVALVRGALGERFQVPEDQIYSLDDPSLVQLEQGLDAFLRRVPSDAKLVVYFVGHAFVGDDGKAYLAPKNFHRGRTASSGLALQWLVDRLESCRAKEKLLLLDCSHAGDDKQTAGQPSVEEMIGTLDSLPGRVSFQTVTVLTSSSKGERGFASSDEKQGLFAQSLARGFSGEADKNRDNRLEWPELSAYVRDQVAAAGAELGRRQTPKLILPDDRPPRLSDDAKKAIQRLSMFVGQTRIDGKALERALSEATNRAPGQPEPQWLAGLLLMEQRKWTEAASEWQKMTLDRPDDLIALQGTAWIQFMRPRATYDAGIEALVELVGRIPKPAKPEAAYSERQLAIFEWAGQLREYAAVGAGEEQRPKPEGLDALDAAVAAHGQAAVERYNAGRQKSGAVQERFAQQVKEAASESRATAISFESRRPVNYASFPYADLVKQILAGMDW